MNELKKQVALRFLTAMGEGDAVSVSACLAPDATTVARNFSKFAGVNQREQIVAMVGGFKSLMPGGLKFNVLKIFGEGDIVGIECDGDAVTRAGASYCNQYCFVMRFAGDKISEIHEYFCSKLAEEVIWPLVAQGAA